MDTQIILFGLWTAVMLTYLLGDVIRIFAGDFEKGKIGDKKMSQTMWLIIAFMMITPILFAVFSLVLDQPINRIMNISGGAIWLLFNLFGLPTYPGYYDRFLLGVSMVFNSMTIWYAYNWV